MSEATAYADKDNSENSEKTHFKFLCVSLTIFILLFIGTWFSVSKLGPTEIGLDFSFNTQRVDLTKVYGAGRHVIGIGHQFITYPSSLVKLEFSSAEDSDGGTLDCFTSDGNAVLIDISFFYKLKRQYIPQLYQDYKIAYHERYTQIAEGELKNIVTNYNTTEIFKKRTEIGEFMKTTLNNILNNFYADVVSLQLRKVDLDDHVEQTLITKVVVAQQARTNEALQDKAVIEAQTQVIISEANAEITILQAVATANSTNLVETAKETAKENLLIAEAESMNSLASQLGFNTNDEVLRYSYLRNIKNEGRESKLIVGFEDGGVLVGGQ